MERRRVLEVLKWVEARDILQAGVVSRQWGELALCEELWTSLYEDYFHLPCESHSPKSAYREDYLATSTLLMIRNSTVTLISVSKLPSPTAVRTISLLQDSGPVDCNAYCLLPGLRALRFGKDRRTEVQLIDLHTGTLSLITPMSCPRCYPGIIRYQHYIYLFGGQTRTSEKLNVRTWKWEGIEGTMAFPPSDLTATRHLTSVYLAYYQLIEAFSLHTEKLGMLQIEAPKGWYHSLCLVAGEDLVLLQGGTMERWKIGAEEGCRVREIQARRPAYYTNCPSIWEKGIYYSLLNDIPQITGVLAFNSHTDELEAILSFSLS